MMTRDEAHALLLVTHDAAIDDAGYQRHLITGRDVLRRIIDRSDHGLAPPVVVRMSADDGYIHEVHVTEAGLVPANRATIDSAVRTRPTLTLYIPRFEVVTCA